MRPFVSHTTTVYHVPREKQAITEKNYYPKTKNVENSELTLLMHVCKMLLVSLTKVIHESAKPASP